MVWPSLRLRTAEEQNKTELYVELCTAPRMGGTDTGTGATPFEKCEDRK